MKTEPYYSKQRLKDYALWYYFRYYSSNKKLLQKLQEKGSQQDAREIYREMEHLLQEDEIIRSKIDAYIFRNKNYRYIRQKMTEKLFPKASIEKHLEKYILSGESILDESFLRRKIDSFIAKGKSRSYILQKLGETREDRVKLKTILDEYFSQGERENILREYERLLSQLKAKPSPERRGELARAQMQKIIQKLIAKGFRYDEIKKVLDI